MHKFTQDSIHHQTISSHAICPLDPDFQYTFLSISDQNRHCSSYLFKLIFYPVISTFNTVCFASCIMYRSSFNINISHLKPVNLKSAITIILNNYTVFILRAESSGLQFW